jgi:hypothetical protein
MGSIILERQFMIHVLNNLTSDYDLQVDLLERRIGDVEQPLPVSKIRAELRLRYERINNKLNKENGDNSEEMEFYGVNLKVNAEVAERWDISHSNVKIKDIKMAVIMVVIQLEEFIVASRDISSKTVSTSRKGTHKATVTTLTLVIVIKKTTSHNIWISQHHWMQYGLKMIFGFVIVVQVHTIVLWI